LLPNEACNLGSLNLNRFVVRADDGGWPATGLDWARLEQTVRIAVRFLDDVIEVNPYPLPEIDAIVKANRRIGLGIMGWADVLFELGIPYDSDEALALAQEVMAFINRVGHDESARLAEVRGPFPNWRRSIYRDGPPLRNATITTIAPTGSISIIAGASSGIEPAFALAFQHTVGERKLKFFNPVFQHVAQTLGLDSADVMDQVAETGSVQGIEQLPAEVRQTFVTAHEVAPEWHVRMQAAFQRQIDNAVSKTVNLPHSATVEDVRRIYLLAHELGCLGVTVYRDGCKAEQVLRAGRQEETVDVPKSIKPRPSVVRGVTHRVGTPLGTAFITINENGAGEPFEVFANVGKAGSDTAAVAEALGRLISLCLRLPSPLDPRDRLEEIVNQLAGIGGGRPLGFGPQRVRSLPDALAQVLAQHLGMAEPSPLAEQMPLPLKPAGDLCPECGEATFAYAEGCRKCYACGYSEC